MSEPQLEESIVLMLPIRHVARAVVFDASDAVLLMRYSERRGDAMQSFWVTPGGALEAGETHVDAARRELLEETGLIVEIGKELWSRELQLELLSGRVHQIERFFLVRVDARSPAVVNTSPEPIEEHRWWTLETLRNTSETIYPEQFIACLAAVEV